MLIRLTYLLMIAHSTIADQFGHSSVVLTADTYLCVAIELGLKSAAAAGRLVLEAGKRPPGGGDVRKRGAPPPCPNDPRPTPTLRDSRAFSTCNEREELTLDPPWPIEG
ncbi:MAG: hypothetical protein ACRDN0_03015 [Trebonia sp.]